MLSPTDQRFLRQFPGLKLLSDADLVHLARNLEPLHLPPGGLLFRQGGPGDAFYLLITGELEIVITAGEQTSRRTVPLEEGALFGEISALLGQPRSAAAVARTETAVYRLPSLVLNDALERGERWAVRFLSSTAQSLARRIAALDKEMAELRQ